MVSDRINEPLCRPVIVQNKAQLTHGIPPSQDDLLNDSNDMKILTQRFVCVWLFIHSDRVDKSLNLFIFLFTCTRHKPTSQFST